MVKSDVNHGQGGGNCFWDDDVDMAAVQKHHDKATQQAQDKLGFRKKWGWTLTDSDIKQVPALL